jgi:hypothetical protein
MLAEPVGPQRREAPPSLTVTVLLTLSWLALWLGVVRACVLLLVLRRICWEMKLALPQPAKWLFGFSWWDWFGSYGGWVVVGTVVLAPAVGLLTYWVRHCLRSRLAGWAWGILLIVPPSLFLVVAAEGLGAADQAVLHELQSDDPENYLAPDGQQLLSRLTFVEVRHGVAGPEGETVVIEPKGDWRVIRGVNEWERPPRRQGKLTRDQLAMLAAQLAQVRFLQLSEPEQGLLPVGQNGLVIRFGDRSWIVDVVPRQRLLNEQWGLQGLQGIKADFRDLMRFASLVLVIEELVKSNQPD